MWVKRFETLYAFSALGTVRRVSGELVTNLFIFRLKIPAVISIPYIKNLFFVISSPLPLLNITASPVFRFLFYKQNTPGQRLKARGLFFMAEGSYKPHAYKTYHKPWNHGFDICVDVRKKSCSKAATKNACKGRITI